MSKVAITLYDRLINRLTDRVKKQNDDLKNLWDKKHSLKRKYEEAIELLLNETTITKEVGDRALNLIANGEILNLFEIGLAPYAYGWQCKHSEADELCSDCSNMFVFKLIGIETGLEMMLFEISNLYLEQTGTDLYE